MNYIVYKTTNNLALYSEKEIEEIDKKYNNVINDIKNDINKT